jgi:hypothetical protein
MRFFIAHLPTCRGLIFAVKFIQKKRKVFIGLHPAIARRRVKILAGPFRPKAGS